MSGAAAASAASAAAHPLADAFMAGLLCGIFVVCAVLLAPRAWAALRGKA